jgi:hypothetical protein
MQPLRLYDISDFFRSYRIGVFDSEYAPYLPNIVTGIVLGWTNGEDLTGPAQELAAVGHYLTRHPAPPWVSRINPIWTDFFWGHPKLRELAVPDPDPFFYLGAAATVLIATESMMNYGIPVEGAQRFGFLNQLYPSMPLN